MNKPIVLFIFMCSLTFISSVGRCDESNKQLARLIDDLKEDDREASNALKLLMVGSKETWEVILQFSHKEPERYVHLTQEWSMQVWVQQHPEYFSYLYQRAEVDEVVAKNEAILWDIGWYRKALEVVSSNTRIGDLESKTSPGVRRIAIEFIKRKAGEDFGFHWNEEPDSVMNKQALVRINRWLASPRFARVNQGGDFVIATVVNVRSEPSIQGSILGRLRIGTQVDVLQTLNEWTEIVYTDAMIERLHGYITTAFLAPRSLSLDNAISTARSALERGNPEEALVFSERAFAIDGSSLEAAELLKSLYQQLQRSQNLAYLESILHGRRTEYLAVCTPPNLIDESSYILLLAKFSSTSGLQKVTLLQEASDSLLYSWFYITTLGDQIPVEPGAFFLNSKYIAIGYSNEYVLAIGKNCLSPGAIYSTAPFENVIKNQSNWQRTIDLLKPLQTKILEPEMRETSWVQGIEGYRIQDRNSIDSVNVHYIVKYVSHHDVGYVSIEPLSVWVLLTADGSILKTIGHGGSYLDSVREISWTRWKFLPGSKIGIILHQMISGPTTYDIVFVSHEGKLQSLEVVVAQGGC